MLHHHQTSFRIHLTFAWLLHNGIQEQIAASHEFDGVRKEKERLTAASLNKSSCTLQRHINNLSIISFPIHQTDSHMLDLTFS